MAIHLRADGLVVVPDWNSASCGVVWCGVSGIRTPRDMALALLIVLLMTRVGPRPNISRVQVIKLPRYEMRARCG
jgi:hypothetical protein